ncbi:MAG: glutamate synthase [Armatimonadetes bacterium]|nr:glutamate synthase [Armatimonadota bacterium]
MAAGTPLGPAAGPHDQLAQNIVLAWLGGSRIMELKTVQILDDLAIPRPCIQAPNICFNVEWSQELRLEASAKEYVTASMLVDILKKGKLLAEGPPEPGPAETIFDFSVGYSLEGISSPRVRAFVESMKNAGPLVESLRKEIPEDFRHLRELDFSTELCKSITLSTFHGCPPDEIEGIVHFLLTELGVHTIIKLNPTQLGKEKLEHLLHDRLGYTHLEVNQNAYTAGLTLDEAVQMLERLEPVARKAGLGLGVKFSNTLEVVNKDKFFDDEIMYLSGPPLHVIAVSLVDEFKKRMGTRFPISFSAGIDRTNFPNAVAMGLVPITVCTDLLKPRGYGRQITYLTHLEEKMKNLGIHTIEDYVLKVRGNAHKAFESALSGLSGNDRDIVKDILPDLLEDLSREKTSLRKIIREKGEKTGYPALLERFFEEAVKEAVMLNTSEIAEATVKDPRYTWEKNRSVPKRIGSRLHLFDCISCDKCVPVCPNNANFTYETQVVDISFHDFTVTPNGVIPSENRRFKLERSHQIACFADFCNECGNCDTFCPEEGGPYKEKPLIFGSRDTWDRSGKGFFMEQDGPGDRILGRISGKEYELDLDRGTGVSTFSDNRLVLELDRDGKILGEARLKDPSDSFGNCRGHTVEMTPYFQMKAILEGVLSKNGINYVNARYRHGPAIQSPSPQIPSKRPE